MIAHNLQNTEDMWQEIDTILEDRETVSADVYASATQIE
jgi:hypothetical protein